MKPCNYLSESIVLVTPAVGDAYKAKLVTEYGYNSTGGLIVVSTRYVDAANEVITLGVDDELTIVSSGQPVTAQKNCIINTEQDVCVNGAPLRMVTEYGFNASGGLIVVSTRYVNASNEVQTLAVDAEIVYGNCAQQCKGAHAQTVTLVAGLAQTITHGFNLGSFTRIGYSVIGADDAVNGQWPTGVRFINHTANTVDIIADGVGGVVDVVLTNPECLLSVGSAASTGDAAVVASLQAQIGDLQNQINNILLDAFDEGASAGTTNPFLDAFE